jgi:hypothetical protein
MGLSFLQLQEIVSGYLQTTSGAMVINGVNLCQLAINNAQRTAQLAHDFYYNRVNCFLPIAGTQGAPISANISSTQPVTVAGTLSPNAVGSYNFAGNYEGVPFYTNGSFLLFYSDAMQWVLTNEGFNPTDFWFLNSTNQSPNGTYTAAGSATGVPTVSGAGTSILIKRIENVLLPLANGFDVPIEFLTSQDWNSRQLRLNGRQAWNPGLTPFQLGIGQNAPTAYQQGQQLFIVPSAQFTFPVTAQLSVIQFLPDLVNSDDTNFLTQFGPEYLQWQGILEGNKLLEAFVQRREGNLDETNLQAEAQLALQALIGWDVSISNGTSTPAAPIAAPPANATAS